MNTTLNKIREHGPCADGWRKLLSHLGKTEADDEPLSIITILDSNGLDDALWCLRAIDVDAAWEAVWAIEEAAWPIEEEARAAATDDAARAAAIAFTARAAVEDAMANKLREICGGEG